MENVVDELVRWLDSHTEEKPSVIMDHVCSFLMHNVDTYNWVGIYIVQGDSLKLHSFAGEETEHVNIRIGDGLCSLAVLKNATVNEPDVKSNTEYLACFPGTESELVVPIMHGGKSVGEIDIDSDTKAAFGMKDEKLMAVIAEHLSEVVAGLSGHQESGSRKFSPESG